jgi:hypothetical protein
MMIADNDPWSRRDRWISRFRECQRRRRKWIGFWDIADWIASGRGATDRRDEDLRQQAYDDLLNAVLASEFERGGKSFVLCILPDSRPEPGSLRLTPQLLRERISFSGEALIVEQVLPRCWVPRDLAWRWFARRGMAWPAIFDAAVDVARLSTLYPPADAAAGSEMHKQSHPAPDWAPWLARDLWRLDQAVALSLSIDPWSAIGRG